MTELWVLPPPNRSSWFAKIDWYLNWQLCKGLTHEKRRPAVELLRVNEDNEIPWFEPPTFPKAPLLVATRGRIPADGCMVLETGHSLKAWLTEVRRINEQLRGKSLRVFLPPDYEPKEAADVWRGFSHTTSDCKVEFTADEEAKTWPTQSKKN
jgi:hypothetical protein